MAIQKACKECKTIIESGSRCPKCSSENISDNSKGKIIIINPEQSEIAQKLKIKDKGTYAIKA
jgi:DNA-directed RNA polymerase subunit E"